MFGAIVAFSTPQRLANPTFCLWSASASLCVQLGGNTARYECRRLGLGRLKVMKIKSVLGSALNSRRNAPSDRFRFLTVAASAGFIACLLFAVPASAQPRTFCLNGFTWETVTGVPSGPARELTLIENFSLGSQMLFRSPRLRDEILVSVHEANTCHTCHSPVASNDEAMTRILDEVSELSVIEPSRRESWFDQEHTAFLARRTGDVCEPDGSRVLLAGPPIIEGVLRHQESGSDTRFIIESDTILRELQAPERAPVLISPRR